MRCLFMVTNGLGKKVEHSGLILMQKSCCQDRRKMSFLGFHTGQARFPFLPNCESLWGIGRALARVQEIKNYKMILVKREHNKLPVTHVFLVYPVHHLSHLFPERKKKDEIWQLQKEIQQYRMRRLSLITKPILRLCLLFSLWLLQRWYPKTCKCSSYVTTKCDLEANTQVAWHHENTELKVTKQKLNINQNRNIKEVILNRNWNCFPWLLFHVEVRN